MEMKSQITRPHTIFGGFRFSDPRIMCHHHAGFESYIRIFWLMSVMSLWHSNGMILVLLVVVLSDRLYCQGDR